VRATEQGSRYALKSTPSSAPGNQTSVNGFRSIFGPSNTTHAVYGKPSPVEVTEAERCGTRTAGFKSCKLRIPAVAHNAYSDTLPR
jgi:hypothetical protein